MKEKRGAYSQCQFRKTCRFFVNGNEVKQKNKPAQMESLRKTRRREEHKNLREKETRWRKEVILWDESTLGFWAF